MAETKLRCPHCEAVLIAKAAPPPGKEVKCPKCGNPFVPNALPSEEFQLVEEAPPVAKTRPPVARESSLEFEDEEPASLTTRSRRPRGSSVPILIAIIGVGVGLLGLAVGGFFWWREYYRANRATIETPSAKNRSGKSAVDEKPADAELQGGDTPEEVYAAFAKAHRDLEFRKALPYVNPVSRMSLAVIAASLAVDGPPITNIETKLKLAFLKRKANFELIEPMISDPSFEKTTRIVSERNAYPPEFYDALMDFIRQHRPLAAEFWKTNDEKLVDVKTKGNRATGTLVKSKKSDDAKADSEQQSTRIAFDRVDGRWYVDLTEAADLK